MTLQMYSLQSPGLPFITACVTPADQQFINHSGFQIMETWQRSPWHSPLVVQATPDIMFYRAAVIIRLGKVSGVSV
jgi:hypothetical protein